ncbi:mechanosensitive ion channel family protein [Micromonospora sp. LZ34]
MRYHEVSARTQIRPVRRLTSAVVMVVAVGLILVTFRTVRSFGLTFLTSAGVIGLSARTALGNAFAGIQVAFADSLHVDDVLVMDGDWGRVEEVKLTNVVIRLWDDPMLVLPTTYFTEHAFQNWTRHETRVVGEIRIQLDHTADLDDLRQATRRLVESSPRSRSAALRWAPSAPASPNWSACRPASTGSRRRATAGMPPCVAKQVIRPVRNQEALVAAPQIA